MKKLMKIVKNEDGQVLVLMALLLVVLLGCAALVIDTALVYGTKGKLQNAANAAALAGARYLPNDTSTANSTAINYGGLNGASETTPTAPYNGDSTKIEVVCKKTILYQFARVLGFKQADVSARAVAQKTTFGDSGDPFGYALFAGEGAVSYNGANHNFDGGVYGRDGVDLGQHAEILHGNAVSSNGTCSSFTGPGNSITNNPVIPMPDFSGLIRSQGIFINNQAEFDVTVNGKSVNGPIYVNSSLIINGRIAGNGIIYANGTITFKNNNSLQTSQDSICFYAEKGNMTVEGGYIGILYSPHGLITINGGPNTDTYGRIIAKNVNVDTGAKASVYATANDLNAFNTLKAVKLVQ
jgi:hypothetical protein